MDRAWLTDRESIMATPIEIFDRWLSQFDEVPPPRRFTPPKEIALAFDLQTEKFKERMEGARKMFKPNHSIEIYANFIDDPGCTACADIREYLGLVGFSKGLVLLPLDLFWRMFSHPAFLPNAGDCSKERISARHRDGVVNDYDILIKKRELRNKTPWPQPPLDKVRENLGIICADIVWRFLTWHELVHILHGHIDYLYEKYAVRMVNVVGGVSNSSVPSADLDYQAIELWADAVAARGALENVLTSSDNKGPYALLQSPRQKLFFWSIAMFSLFRLWEYSVNPAELQGRHHPPSPVRFTLIADGDCRDFAESFPEIGDSYADIVREGQFAVEQGIAYCGGARLTREDLGDPDDPRLVSHCNSLLAHYRDVLIPEMQKRSYINLAIGQPETQPQTPP